MKKTLPWILLAASVAFNVFVLVGMLRAHSRPRRMKTPEGLARRLAEELEMDAQQEAECIAWARKVSAARTAFEKGIDERHQKFWAEIVKDHPDEAVLQEFLQSQGADPRRRFVSHMRDLMKILRPEQRRQAAEFFSKYHCRRRRR